MLISVVVPTIQGREDHYARCVDAYASRSTVDIEIITENDHPAVGPAWNAGAERATGDILHFTADDLEPHQGWDVAAIEAIERGKLPAPRIINQYGHLDSCGFHGIEMEDWAPVRMSVVPFLPRAVWEQIKPVLPIHYFTDDWISYRARKIGWPPVVRRDFAFTHHWATHGRGAGMSYDGRMRHDQRVYIDAVRELESQQGGE